MFKHNNHLVHFRSLAILFLTVSLGLGGCGGSGNTDPETTGDPAVTVVARPTGTPLSPGQQVAIAAEVVAATSSTIEFKWTADEGKLSDTNGQSVIYTAPGTPGLVNVDVVVTSNTGQTTRSVTFEVVGEATATPTATPSPTPTQEPTVTTTLELSPTPTREPSVALTLPGPQEQIECSGRSTCTFTITGVSTIADNAYKIVPFVNPNPGNPNMWLPQPEQALDSKTWQAEVQIETGAGIDPDHRFKIIVLLVDAATQIPAKAQALPPAVAQSSPADFTITADRKISWTPTCPFDKRPPRPPIVGPRVDVNVEITSPADCETHLPGSMPLGGEYSGDLTGKKLWVLVYPTDNKYYPQTPDACGKDHVDAAGGVWTTMAHFGGPPQQYDVVVAVSEAEGEADREFSRWFEAGCNFNSFPGYIRGELPGGLTEVTAITVSTRDE